MTWGPLETPLDAEFIVAIHDPDDTTPWVVQIRWGWDRVGGCEYKLYHQ